MMSLSDQVSAKGQCLSSDVYLPKLLEGLGNLRSQNLLCDVMLEAEGASFPAHKAVLAAASSYCKMRFAGDASSHDSLIKVSSATACGLQNVLSFVYSNQLALTLQTVEETFHAAEVLLVREVMGLCFQFLEESLNWHTCLQILNITKRLGPEELREKAVRCVSRHCKEILADPSWLKELDGATLHEVLDREDVQGLTELDLFHATVDWLHQDATRLKDAPSLLRRIRFPLIPLKDLQTFVQKESLMKMDPVCRRYLQEALDYHSQPYAQPSLQSERTQVRGGADRLLVLGGRSADNTIHDEVWAADQGFRSWRKIRKLSGPAYNHSVAVINSFVFVMGGQDKFDPKGQYPSNKVFRLDPQQNAWIQVASMQARRTRFHAGALNDRLVAVGGGTLLGALTNTAEEYWPAENEWRSITPCPLPMADHAGATHKGILYISGGFASGKTLPDTYSYLSRLRRWVKNRPMTFARCDHGMAASEDKIVCIGGRALTNAGEWVPVSKMESYCPVSDQWTLLDLSAFDLCQFGLAMHQQQLYITGGGSLRQRTKEEGVFVCSPGRKVWAKAGSLPMALADHASCFVRLPCQITSKQQNGGEPPAPGKKKSTLNLFITNEHTAQPAL
ncbi:kelch-like protein 9 [Sceloporus undulatus]|uniref:kelch-like protein 9 n=1 Tax=Sceloporus undulatus TaxID=8520 RepID=UPI001C4B69CA|nr:kelch-like protein 9 [Sceloporus undulatus]